MAADSLSLYAERLAREPFEDVELALQKLSELERKEYELAIPEIGALISLVKVCNVARLNRLEGERNRKVVGWKCPDCGFTMTAFLLPHESRERRCASIYRKLSEVEKPSDRCLPRGQICGALLEVVLDDSAPKADEGPMEPLPEYMRPKKEKFDPRRELKLR